MTETESRRAQEFTELYTPCQRKLYVYIVMLAGDSMAAHDILQDTNLVLWEKFDQFQRGTSFFAFAREVARYRVLRYRQIHARDAVLLEPDLLELVARVASESDDDHDRAYHEALAGCVGKLAATDGDLIRRRYTDNFSVKSLAGELGRTENALSQSLARIRRTLRACVERTLALAGGQLQ
jgi:RNA polymerase sigma-70 factor (ECF subfamily)